MRETENGEHGAHQGEEESQSSESEGDGAEVGHADLHRTQELPSEQDVQQRCKDDVLDGMSCEILYCTYCTILCSNCLFKCHSNVYSNVVSRFTSLIQ